MFLEIPHREIQKEHHGEISGMQENFLENEREVVLDFNRRQACFTRYTELGSFPHATFLSRKPLIQRIDYL